MRVHNTEWNLWSLVTMDVLFLLELCIIISHQVAACPQGCDCSDGSLGAVWCSGKNLSTFPHLKTIPLDALRLQFNKNKITDITLRDKAVIYLSKVAWLNLSHNQITRIPAYEKSVVSAFPGLLRLFLQNNRIHHIDGNAFRGLQHAEEFILSNNHLTKVEASWFDKLFSVRYLRLDNNLISSFKPDNFTWPGKLWYLYLEYNRITTMPPLPIKHCSENKWRCKRTQVGLKGNDIFCGCRRPEHDKRILNMTLPDMSVCCMDDLRDCSTSLDSLYFPSYTKRPVCVQQRLGINPYDQGNKGQSKILPLWSVITFFVLSFIPSLIILALIIDNCTRSGVVRD